MGHHFLDAEMSVRLGATATKNSMTPRFSGVHSCADSFEHRHGTIPKRRRPRRAATVSVVTQDDGAPAGNDLRTLNRKNFFVVQRV